DGEEGLREHLGLPNDGPSSIITPLCVFDFPSDTRRARLKSVHRGSSVDEVRDQTGFEFKVGDDVPVTEGPTASELLLLRTRIDRGGALR
ncbi:MAG TPA: hypothetical protein VIU87_03260, partial [Mycobacterium sp.]